MHMLVFIIFKNLKTYFYLPFAFSWIAQTKEAEDDGRNTWKRII